MTKHTFRVLDYIIDNPNPKMELAINSNCVVEEKLFDKFIYKVKIILDKKCVKAVKLYTSCEAYGKKAEYIRNGLDYDKWMENCSRYLKEIPTAHFGIMSTYNALSITSYTEFLKDVLLLKLRYENEYRNVRIDIPYLDHPKWMNVGILPKSFMPLLQKQIKFMKDNKISNDIRIGFTEYEIGKLERIQYLFQDDPELVNQKDFALFFDEHDRRRNTDFLATFPEMKDFYYYCKGID
jgi:hypothetical protein